MCIKVSQSQRQMDAAAETKQPLLAGQQRLNEQYGSRYGLGGNEHSLNDPASLRESSESAIRLGLTSDIKNRGQKLTLEYSGLTYAVGARVILDNVTGRANPGKLLAIMGPSGAGKTTLLHSLSGRRMAGNLTGRVMVNGNQVNTALMQRISAFVEQLDVLFGTSTPREALLFASKLRLDPSLSEDVLNRKVDSLIEELGLYKCRDSLIGYVGEAAKNSGLKRGLSGGERKRLSIGFELITDPLMVFLDEPTTGLDSFAANSVIRTLERLANQKDRTIIFTIHQPSDEIFEHIDYVHTLAHGKTIYYGPRADLVDYFEEIGRPCPPLTLIPDHLIDVIFGDDLREDELDISEMQIDDRDTADYMKEASELHQKYLNSGVYKRFSEVPPAQVTDLTTTEGRSGKASFLRQYSVLRQRSWLEAIREPRQIRSWIGQTIFLGIFIGLVYYDLGYTQTSVQDRLGVLFFSVMLMFITSFNSPINLFPAERAIFLHEARQGLYDTLPYFLAKLTSESFQLVFKPFLYAVCTYWLMNLNDGIDRFFTFIFIMFALCFCVYSVALMCVCAIPNQAAVLAVMPLIFIPMIIISGFYVNLDTIPSVISWFQHISFVKYGYRALVRNEFDGVNITCTEEEQIIYNCSCPYSSGQDVIDELSMNELDVYTDTVIVIAIGFVCTVLAYFILDRNAKKNI